MGVFQAVVGDYVVMRVKDISVEINKLINMAWTWLIFYLFIKLTYW